MDSGQRAVEAKWKNSEQRRPVLNIYGHGYLLCPEYYGEIMKGFGFEISERQFIIIFCLIFLFLPLSFHASTNFYNYLFPVPGSGYLTRETAVIFRLKSVTPSMIKNLNTSVRVRGAISGDVRGKIYASSDNRTLIFIPDAPYAFGEKVSVRINPIVDQFNEMTIDTTFHFYVSSLPSSDSVRKVTVRDGNDRFSCPYQVTHITDGDPTVINGISVPSDFPKIVISVNDQPGEGFIFFSTTWDSPNHFVMILENDGTPVWYQRSEDVQQDLKLQPDGRLTMLLNGSDIRSRKFIAMDHTYTVVDTFHVPSGYWVDEHELQVMPNGHYFVIAVRDQTMDLSQIIPGGDPNAIVIVNAVVEMDANDRPVFIWRNIDHFDVNDGRHQDISGFGGVVDYTHMNAIDLDHDGHILLSNRHMSEITKINRQTGQIIWRLGGENDAFTWVNDDYHISYQHDIRALDNGNYMVLDNGNFHDPSFSRALEFAVDTLNWTVTKVWEYPETQEFFTWARGNAQRLTNGNTVICWANDPLPIIMEVRPDGTKAFELDFSESYTSYRSFRFPWEGKSAVPYLVTEPRSDGVMLIFNKFGDTDVVKYNIYGGNDPEKKQLIKSTTAPFAHLTGLNNHTMYFFQVTALNQDGTESGFSNEEAFFIQVNSPGENMVMNGDFSKGFQDWSREPPEGGNTELTISEQGELHAHILDGSAEESLCHIIQHNLSLIQDTVYRFEFDAYTSNSRTLEAEIIKHGVNPINISQIGTVWLTKRKKHFSYEFESPYSRFDVSVNFIISQSEYDVYLDNVSLKAVETSNVKQRYSKPIDISLTANYPNPFNQKTVIRYQLSDPGYIEVRVFDVLGHEVADLFHGKQSKGKYQIVWDASLFSSGIYFCLVKSKDFRKIIRMVQLK